MINPWSAERTIEPASVAGIVEEQFPELKPARVVRLGEGWDNHVFLVNETFIFRFPRREGALAGLAVEAKFLQKLPGRLPLAIPLPLFVGKPSFDWPWIFLGYKKLAGASACGARLSDEPRAALAEPLAGFLAALHSINPAPFVAEGLPGDSLGRLDAAALAPRALEYLQQLKARGIWSVSGRMLAFVDACRGLRAGPPRALVHGDLYLRHLLINDRFELRGVIDWGDLHFGDPAADLFIAHQSLPRSAHRAFLHKYGAVADAAWRLAKFRAVFHSAALASYGKAVGDADLLAEGVQGLQRVDASL